MGRDTKIEWTHHTFNPWWGCVKVSPACEHCYAETFSKRVGHAVWGVNAPRRFFGEKHWNEPLRWNADAEAAGVRRRVFCASMADVFEDRPDLVPVRARLFGLISKTPWLDWMLLTKRPQHIVKCVREVMVWLLEGTQRTEETEALVALLYGWINEGQPLRNIWLGTTVEDQRRADERVPVLCGIPAVVRFISCEPLLGPVLLRGLGIGLVICGGESGHGARPMNPAWVRCLWDQCMLAGVAFFFKQWGDWAPRPEFLEDSEDEARIDKFNEAEFGEFHGDGLDWVYGCMCNHRAGTETLYRVGKKYGGRFLDGRIWEEMPEGVTL